MDKNQKKYLEAIREFLEKVTEKTVNVKEFEGKPIVSKQDIMKKTGYQIQDELKQKYSELQKELCEVSKTQSEEERMFELLERMYLIQYSLVCADEINIDNSNVIMNQIVDRLDEFAYKGAEELKIETRQTQIEKVTKEVEKRVEKKEMLDRHTTRVINRTKWEIDNKLMVTIGRYFKSNNDYINVMKVNKKYQALTSEYMFNPISETTLFKHMKEQHFYKFADKKNRISNMECYIYWYNDKEAEGTAQPNEIFKYAIRQENNKGKETTTISIVFNNEHIDDNIHLIEEWTEKTVGKVIYDSEKDGGNGKIFRKKVKGEERLCFIVVDDQENVFGHYHPSQLVSIHDDNYDRGIFLFTLFNNGNSEPKKFAAKKKPCTCLLSDEDFYYCNEGGCDGLWIYELNSRQSNIGGIDEYFKGASQKLITNGRSNFKAKRVIVLQMN